MYHRYFCTSSASSFSPYLHTQHTPYPPPQGPAGMPLRSTQSLLGIQLPTSPEGAAQLLGPMGTSAKMGRTARERERERDRRVSITSTSMHCALARPTLGFPLTRRGREPLVAKDQIPPAVRVWPGRGHFTGNQQKKAAEYRRNVAGVHCAKHLEYSWGYSLGYSLWYSLGYIC